MRTFTFTMYRGSGMGINLDGNEVARLKKNVLNMRAGYEHLQKEVVEALRSRNPYGPAPVLTPVLSSWGCGYCTRQGNTGKTCDGCGAPPR